MDPRAISNGPHRRSVLAGTAAGALAVAATTGAGAQPSRPSPSTKIGPWTFRAAGDPAWLKATVPGTVHTDLLANGVIADPFYRVNERDQQWIDKKDWEYRSTLTLSAADLAHDHVELCFEGLDTYADVYVNDTKVLAADNMFRAWTVDIKPHARAGANSIRIYFHSPIRLGLKALEAFGFPIPSPNDQSEAGGLGDKRVGVFTRKAGYHYGWDWGPRFVTSGIWRPVQLRVWNAARIKDLRIEQDAVSADLAELTARFEILASRSGPATVELTCSNDPALSARTTLALKPGLNIATLKLSIARPKLWWTNGLGEPHLYRLQGRLVTAAASDTREVATGLRTVKLVQKPDAYGTSFYIELNGVPVFMKGANYIPNDSFLPRITSEVYRRVVQSAVDTHMNMLRVWGGGIYENDEFYDLCDQNGILIWQDFMFACSMLPDDPAFFDNIREEVTQNIRRLRNHPCIAVWCGNNEIDAAWQARNPDGGWGWKKTLTQAQQDRLTRAYDVIFHDILPRAVEALDPQRFYWPSSPIAAWDGKTGVLNDDLNREKQSGDIHYWGVWWGQKPFSEYRKAIGRFMTEYGFQSFPEFRTVASYTQPGDHDIFSDVMKSHQRSSIGNGTIKAYMELDYVVPKDFRQFLYVGQVLQAEGIKVAMEGHRVRMPFCMGSLFWQINDCWPVASWSSIDYYGRWKAQHFFARKAFAPILISTVLDGDVVRASAVSDLLQDRKAVLSLQVLDFDGTVHWQQDAAVVLKANASETVFQSLADGLLNGRPAERSLLRVRLMDGSETLSENLLYFRPVKNLALPETRIDSRLKALGKGEYALALTAPALVKNLLVSLEGHDATLSDNYFDLLPGETRIIQIMTSAALSEPEATKALTLMHMKHVRAG